MSKAKIIEDMRSRHKMTEADAVRAFDATAASIRAVADESEARVPGLGTFKRKFVEGRTGRNPATGEPVTIAARNKLVFKAAKGV